MELTQVREVVESTPVMILRQAETITAHVLQQRPSSVLERGFHHGVSTCYLAVTLD